MSPHASGLIVPARFCGPPSSGNGGWTSGALAGFILSSRGTRRPEGLLDPDVRDDRVDAWPPVRVSLRQPPPLDTSMTVVDVEGRTEASFGGAVVAHATLAEVDPAPVEPVAADEARAAMAAYPGLRSHPFPTCFACGTAREDGDGLRIFPGPVTPAGQATRVAATWTPHPSTAEPFESRRPSAPLDKDWHVDPDAAGHASLAVTWASLDCVGGWAGDLTERMMVLASMTARVDTLPVVGEEHVVVGEARGRDGRKTFTASTLYDRDGRVVAVAEHLWVAVDPATFG